MDGVRGRRQVEGPEQQTVTTPSSSARRARGASLGLSDLPPSLGLHPTLATPRPPVQKYCRPVAPAHFLSTASHYDAVVWPKRDCPSGSLVVFRDTGQEEVQAETERPSIPNVTPAPSCLSLPCLSLDVWEVHQAWGQKWRELA